MRRIRLWLIFAALILALTVIVTEPRKPLGWMLAAISLVVLTGIVRRRRTNSQRR